MSASAQGPWTTGYNVHVSHIACSQHGNLNALTASLLHMAQRSFAGISSVARELFLVSHGADDASTA